MLCFGPRPAFAVGAASALAAPFRLALATLFAVPRPSGAGITVFEHQDIAAFPSGHTFLAVVAWGTLAATTRVPAWLAALAAVATAISRVYLGAHFPADVLASLLLGPLFVWAFLRGWRRLEPPLLSVGARAWRVTALVGSVGLIALALGPLRPRELLHWEMTGLAGATLLALSGASSMDGSAAPHHRCRAGVAGLTLAGLAGLAFASRVAPGPAHPWLGAVFAGAAGSWVLAAVPRLLRRA